MGTLLVWWKRACKVQEIQFKIESNAMVLQKVELSSQYDWIFLACNVSKQGEATLVDHVRKDAIKGRALGNVADGERLQLDAFFNTMASI